MHCFKTTEKLKYNAINQIICHSFKYIADVEARSKETNGSP